MTTPIDRQLTPPGGWRIAERQRVASLAPHETGLGARLTIRVINRVGGLDASNLFLMLMRNLRLFSGWLHFASRLMPHGGLPRRETELVVLRVGWNCRARYEWGQHVDIALRVGVTAEDIARIPFGADASGWDVRSQTLMRACDEFHQERFISAPTWLQLSHHYKASELLELVMLIGHYEMLAGVLNSTGLPLDTRLEERLAQAPIHQRRADGETFDRTGRS